MTANIELSGEDIDIFIRNIGNPSPDVIEAREQLLTEEVNINHDALIKALKSPDKCVLMEGGSLTAIKKTRFLSSGEGWG